MTKQYQTIILLSTGDKAELDLIAKASNQLTPSGSLFVLWRHRYARGAIQEPFPAVISKVLNFGFDYINTIVLPSQEPHQSNLLNNNVQYLLWFCKDLKQLGFNKDVIREKHVWKDVEWGGRAKNYNPKGKDPGNVWIPTKDDGKGKITAHILLSNEDWINRCLQSTAANNQPALLYLPKHTKISKNKLTNSNVKFSYFDATNINQDGAPQVSGYKTGQKVDQSGLVIFDTSEAMSKVKSNSVDLMVTSPPYWDLKDYFKEGEIGQESYDSYLNRMNLVWRECSRVLKSGASAFVNIDLRVKKQEPIPIPLDIIKQFNKLGFKLVDIIIWHKSSGIPTHSHNLVKRHEYILWFAKKTPPKFNATELVNVSDYKNESLNHGLLWNLNRKAGSVGSNFIHPAIYPLSLTDRIIKLTTSKGDLVLDPFLGSGTTLISALKLGRRSVNYEYNQDFEPLIKHRLEKEAINPKLVSFDFSTSKKVDDKESLQIFRRSEANFKTNEGRSL